MSKGSFTDLLSFVGDENFKLQYLSSAMKEAKTNRKGVTTISFLTEAATTSDIFRPLKDSNVGIVVWIPRHKIDEFCKDEKS